MNRRHFLKLGSLFVPVVAAPTVAYSFLWAPSAAEVRRSRSKEIGDMIARSLADSIAAGFLDVRRVDDWMKHVTLQGTISV